MCLLGVDLPLVWSWAVRPEPGGGCAGALSGDGGLSLFTRGAGSGGWAQALSGDPLPSALQELLSHSTDRPERQQLKEALEAMQVGHRGRGEAGQTGLCGPGLPSWTGPGLTDDLTSVTRDVGFPGTAGDGGGGRMVDETHQEQRGRVCGWGGLGSLPQPPPPACSDSPGTPFLLPL